MKLKDTLRVFPAEYRTYAGLSVASVCTQAASAALGILVARNSSAKEFGIVATALSLAGLAATACNLGAVTYISRQLARGTCDARGAVYATWRRVRWVVLAQVVVVAALLALGLGYVGLMLACIAYSAGVSMSVAVSSYALALRRFRLSVAMSAAEKCIPLGLWLALSQVIPRGTFLYPFCLAVGAGFTITIGLIWLGATPWHSRDATKTPTRVIRRSHRLGIAELSSDLYMLEVPIVALAGGATIAGHFSVVTRLAGPLALPIATAVTVISPRMYSHKGEPRKALNEGLGLWVVFPAYWCLLCILAVTTTSWVSMLYGEQYSAAATPARILLASLALSSVAQFISVLLKSQDRDAELAISFSVSVLCGLSVAALGSHLWGVTGAVLGALSVQVLLVCLLGSVAFRILNSAPRGMTRSEA